MTVMKMLFGRRCWAGLALLLQPLGLLQAAQPPPVAARQQMVVSAQHLASDIGNNILAQGGNAVDAAVAVGYALAVVHPCCGNLGGGGFMTLHLAEGERDISLNFREKAPAAAHRDMFLDEHGEVVAGRSLRSWLGVGVPGTVAGLDAALQRFGTMSRRQVMQPAINLAVNGYQLSAADAEIIGYGRADFARHANTAAIFLRDGEALKAGDRLQQRDLGATLELIAEHGPGVFYDGPIAAKVVAASSAEGGILSRQDFRDYQVTEQTPIVCDYRGFEVVSAPPPSSGGVTLCLILNILEAYPLGELGVGAAQGLHYQIEAMRHAFIDRNSLLGDPDFIDNPIQRLLSDDYAASLRGRIDKQRAASSAELGPAADGDGAQESAETTHVSVLDRWGNAVAMTTTVNGYFGIRQMAADTGFFLNNEMDDFTSKPGVANMFGLVQGERNAIAPGKRPLSSMSPTVVKREGEVVMVLGSPGGSRIISIVAQGIINAVDHGMNISEAVNQPRIHHQWLPDTVFAEPRAINPDSAAILREMGHSISVQRPWGAMEAIMRVPSDGLEGDEWDNFGDDSSRQAHRVPGMVYGANDNRRPAGSAVGE